jgi:Tfp pilus assembly protein PilV
MGMLAIGVVGVISLFATGLQASTWSNNTTKAAMEARTLYTRILAETDDKGNRIFLNRISDPQKPPAATAPSKEWIHSANASREPVKIDPEGSLWWACRVSKYQMDADDPLDAGKDKKAKPYKELPYGLYQICIAVYRHDKENWTEKPPVAVYTTYVTAGF